MPSEKEMSPENPAPVDEYEDMSGEEEDASDYCKGGYHPVRLQDEFKDGRYRVVRKLGWGHFSTVWLAYDAQTNHHVALKVVKSAKNYTAAARDEIELCERVVKANPTSRGHPFIVQLLDHFVHYGPHGAHVCMVFEVLGENLLSLIRRYRRRGGLPLSLVKDVTYQILLGLDYMHEDCQMIHTDLKPENVLVCIPNVEAMIRKQLDPSLRPALPMSPEATPQLCLPNGRNVVPAKKPPADTVATTQVSFTSQMGGFSFGQSTTANGTPSSSTGATTLSIERTMEDITLSDPSKAVSSKPPSSPTIEVSQEFYLANSAGDIQIISSPTPRPSATPSPPPAKSDKVQVKIADLGNACWVNKHFTEDIQTRQYRSPEVILGVKWGPTTDIWSLACMVFELLTGDFLFHPKNGKKYTKDDDHLAQMIETIGPFPRQLYLNGQYSREYFNRRGELRYITRFDYWTIADRLREEYHWSKDKADAVQGFLMPMLQLHPDKRATARTMLNHVWLKAD
ncbi:serine/threonine protein kinase, CMGC [Dispira simplex]|nr:serine/threonine protein kinase, CMGC [Dispira simplex]